MAEVLRRKDDMERMREDIERSKLEEKRTLEEILNA
jgi:hypothetical protein